jgi:hypothetical protein
MDLKKVIESKDGTLYKFALHHGLKPQLVYYWCKKDWKRLNYSTREKICKLLKIKMKE